MKYQEYHEEKLSEILKDNSKIENVLELGCGQGANMAYLAKRHPNVKFMGIDLYPSLDKKNQKYDITLIQGDYHDLSMIEDNSIDMIYALETLCYSQNKNQIFKEVNRVLKPVGNIDQYIKNNNFEIVKAENMKSKVINHLKHYQTRIQRYLNFGLLFTFFCKMLPKEVLGNIVPVYFMADTVEMDFSVYMNHIL